MGEVGAAIPEKQVESPFNGELNGVCKTVEQSDIEIGDDSQISSENGVSDVSQDDFTSNLKISKAESLNIKDGMLKVASVSSIAMSSFQSPDILAKSSKDKQMKQNESGINRRDDLKENGTSTATNQGVAIVSQSDTKKLVGSQNNYHDNIKTTEGKDTSLILALSSEKKLSESKGGINGAKISEKKEISEEIEIIESDDDDDQGQGNVMSASEKKNNEGTTSTDRPNNVLAQKSEIKIANVQENVEQIDVDPSSNGNTTDNNDMKDDDSAVIIQSDSDECEYEAKKMDLNKINQNKNVGIDENQANKRRVEDEVHEILSDKDDCVVIEDDDKKEKDLTRRGSRQRKSVVKARDFAAYDDYIQEFVESPTGQPPLKRLRTSLEAPPIQSNIHHLPQVGQITIKDARSLMGPFVDNSPKTTFQQQFIQATGGKGTKEPTLVIIDTNSMQKIGSPQGTNVHPAANTNMQNLQKPNAPFSVLPVALPAQGVYPINVRPTLAPLSAPQPKLAPGISPMGVPPGPITNQNLLPALTDDMFVLEAPSFIVPYIYEKPPSDNLKQIIQKMSVEIENIKKEQAEQKKASEDVSIEDNTITDIVIKDEKIEESEKNDSTKQKKRRRGKNPDDSWDESDTSTDEEASDSESRTKVLIKEVKEDLEIIQAHITPDLNKEVVSTISDTDKKSDNYFESPLGKFFIDIGINLVQEYVQTDLLRQQKRKRDRLGKASPEVQVAINSLKKNLETSRRRNEPFKFEVKRCEFCNFKSESALAMAHHYEAPHMRTYLYKCNFCTFETRPPHDMLFHMEAVHNIKGRLDKAPSYHQCPNCPFEDNGKSKLARHSPVCAKKFRPECNLLPPHDWEAPAKIPRIKPRHGLVGTATAYQAMAAQAAAQKAALATISARSNAANNNTAMIRNRGRPQTVTRTTSGGGTVLRNNQPLRHQMPGMILSNNYQIAGGQLIQQGHNIKKAPGQQPSISITPLPRQPGGGLANMSAMPAATITPASKPQGGGAKPGQTPPGGKASFVICEICDGYIKDLEQLRHHMQWMHKVKIHPKMIYNRPPLNCQKCQFRFFTDQGLERHLLGSHGLVTSSMQEAANKGKDAGRCPVCGRMYQWKLLNHVSRDHHMTLKPAHLSYKCTVCTATFGMYKQFENHVYTAHSTVAKKAMDTKKSVNNCGMPSSSNSGSSNKGGLSSFTSGDSLLKPLKINDEITIIPQPATKRGSANDYGNHIID